MRKRNKSTKPTPEDPQNPQAFSSAYPFATVLRQFWDGCRSSEALNLGTLPIKWMLLDLYILEYKSGRTKKT